ncbi:MAG TPA: hypothetical protein VIM30_05755 [Candidatus Limnocylindrales bacterium]
MTSTRAGPRAARFAVIGPWFATIGISLGAVVLLGLGWSAPVPDSYGFRGFGVIFATTFGTVGALIRIRAPNNRVGWLFVGIGMLSAVTAFITEYLVYGALVEPGSLPWVSPIAWLLTWVWVPYAGTSVTFLLLLFPDGHLPSPRWRPVAWLAALTIVYLSAASAFAPGPIPNAPFIDNPFGVEALGRANGWIGGIAYVLLAFAAVLSAASLILRFRRARGIERAQLKWFALAAAFAGFVLAGPVTTFNLIFAGNPTEASRAAYKASQVLTIVAFLGIPISAGIAILRYRLYDIDRIISRTLAYAVLTAILAAVYVVGFLGLQSALAPFTANGGPFAVAASTLVVFALFQPVRRRIQGAVDRRFYRSRYDAQREIESFAARVRYEVEVDRLAVSLSTTLERTMQPASASIWLRSGGSAGADEGRG